MPLGPLVVNILTADLVGSSALTLVPVTAPMTAPHSLDTLDAIAAADGRHLIAGINGGYFYRLDVNNFFDGVCIGKSASVAELPPNTKTPNTGVADGAIVSRGVLLGSNCDCLGYNMPVFLTLNGSSSVIDVLGRAAPPPAGLLLDSLAAGPNLVSTNSSGTFIDVRNGDENFANVYEWSANTGIGFTMNGTSSVFVTFDGFDGCAQTNGTCGTNAFTMAYFFKDFLMVEKAMGMDQGGSTTMWVEGEGIVTNPGANARPIFSGLFLQQQV